MKVHLREMLCSECLQRNTRTEYMPGEHETNGKKECQNERSCEVRQRRGRC